MNSVLFVVPLIINVSFVIAQPDTNTDCSWANVTGFHISPLDGCLNSVDGTSTKVYCDDKGNNIFQDAWSSLDCRGKRTITQLNLKPEDFNCDKMCSSEHSLLPPAPQQASPTHSPTHIPTKTPTSHPSMSPITHPPTEYGDTRAPTLTPTLIPSFSPTLIDNTIDTNVEPMKSNKNNNEQYIYTAPSIPIHIICLIITVSLFIASIYYLVIKKQNKNKKQIVSSIKIFILLTFVSNIIGISCLLSISIIMSTSQWTQNTYNKAIIAYYVLSNAYSFGKLCLELFYLFRVYKAFKNSAFYLSKIKLIILIFCLTIISFMWCFLFIVSTKTHLQIPNYFYLIVSVSELFLVLILLYLFANRLSFLLLRHKYNFTSESKTKTKSPTLAPHPSTQSSVSTDERRKSDTTNSVAISTPKPSLQPYPSTVSTQSAVSIESTSKATIKSIESSLSNKQIKWIFLITRCILLSSISLISTIIFGIFAFYYSQFGIHIFIVYTLWSIDMAVNSLCLYLNFIFANKMYNKLCVYGHGICQKMVQHVTARKMVKKYLNDMENLENANETTV